MGRSENRDSLHTDALGVGVGKTVKGGIGGGLTLINSQSSDFDAEIKPTCLVTSSKGDLWPEDSRGGRDADP